MTSDAPANFHAVRHHGTWAVRRTGASRVTLKGLSKALAWQEARRRARAQSSIAYLHDRGGRIICRNSYEPV